MVNTARPSQNNARPHYPDKQLLLYQGSWKAKNYTEMKPIFMHTQENQELHPPIFWISGKLLCYKQDFTHHYDKYIWLSQCTCLLLSVKRLYTKCCFCFFSKFCFPVFIFKYTSLSLNIPPISTKGFICKVMFFILLKSWLSSLNCLISPWWFLQIMQEYFNFTFQFSSIDIYFHNDLEDIDAITNMWYNALTTTSFITCRLSKLECYFWCLHGVTVAHFNILIM